MFRKILVLGFMSLATTAYAADHRVEMLNVGADGAKMVFEPAVVFAEPGDTVTFVPTDKSHNAQSEKGLIPEGAEAFKGKINQELTITVEVPGIYGVICQPHRGMGMGMTIVVGGDTSNIGDLKEAKFPKILRERFDAQIAQIEEQVASNNAAPADGAAEATETADAAEEAPAEAAAGGLPTEEALANAKTNYVDFCAACHAENGRGDIGPALRGNGKLADAAAVFKQMKQGGSEMPGFDGVLSDDDILAVGTYIRTNFGNKYGPMTDVDAGIAN